MRGTLADGQYENLVVELEALPEKIEKTLADKERIQWFASKYANAKDAFFIGRGLDYAVALEGSLKFKEISYIHSEAFAAGEMKHGPIALIDAEMPVVIVATQSPLYEKVLSNIQEIKARKGRVVAVVTEGDTVIRNLADYSIELPATLECLNPLVASIPLQLLAYYIAVCRGMDVDQPRNLAKSVTVE